MTQESLLNTNWNSGDEIAATELNTHGQEHLDLDGHGDAFHAVQYLKSLTGGNGIDPSSIGDGDTVSVAWGDAVDLDADGNILADTIDTAELSVRPFTYDPGMTEWEDNLSDEEINRMVLQSGEFLRVERIEFRQKGGGSSSVASLQVADSAAGSDIGTVDLGSTARNPGFSGSGGTNIIIRVTNNTGSSINAAPRVLGYITGV